MAVRLDAACIQRLIEAAAESASGSNAVTVIHHGEPHPPGQIENVVCRVGSLTIRPRSRVNPGDADVADLEVRLTLDCPEAQTEESVMAIATAVAQVAAALEETALRHPSSGTPEHVVELDRVAQEIEQDTQQFHQIVRATLTVTGTAKRLSGTSREDFTA